MNALLNGFTLVAEFKFLDVLDVFHTSGAQVLVQENRRCIAEPSNAIVGAS